MALSGFGSVVLPSVDPSAVWNLDDLYRAPEVTPYQETFRGEVTPIWIEGVPYRGKPTRCFAFYGMPTWASKERPAPGIVLVHGGAGTAYPEWVRLWVRRGYAAVCVDTCGSVPVQLPNGKWMSHPDGGPRGWGRIDQVNDPVVDQWPYHAVAAVIRSHSFLRAQEGVDATNIGITGISWGGFLTCIVAAADSRLKYAIPVYGCGFNYERGGEVWSHPDALTWAERWDASVFLPYAKIPFLWVDGTNDFAFSLDRVSRSAALGKGPQAFCTRLRMLHGHGSAGEGPEEILAFANHYAKGGRDVIRVGKIEKSGDHLVAAYSADGRRVARAELLFTEDPPSLPWHERQWRVSAGEILPGGRISAEMPVCAREAVFNVISDEGLIASSPHWSLDVSPAERLNGCDVGRCCRILAGFSARKILCDILEWRNE